MWELTEIYCHRASKIFLPVSEWKVPAAFYCCKDCCRFDVWVCIQGGIAVEHNGYYHVPWSQTGSGRILTLGQVLYPLWAWIYSSCLSQRIVVKIKWDFFLSQHSASQIVRVSKCKLSLWPSSSASSLWSVCGRGAPSILVLQLYQVMIQNPSHQWGTRGKATGIWFIFQIMYFLFSFYFLNTHPHIFHTSLHTWF